MFDILFGWRKASKCKRLIRQVQCRLKLLKNRRCCIVKQSRDDVAQLLKHGHDQIAFQRVDQLFKDECMIKVYDLLDHFCEYIIINLGYIRKHKECTDDINEAASTLIFSSARFGDLPELLSIKKLFGERYGQKFITAALELLPGNLVNHQIKENIYIRNVPDNVKYGLLNEISSNCVGQEQLLLEYKPLFQENEATEGGSNEKSCKKDLKNSLNRDLELQIVDTKQAEGKIVCVDLASESIKLSKDPILMLLSGHGEVRELDYIEEVVPSLSKNGNLQDQRLFIFKSLRIPQIQRTYYANYDNNFEEQVVSTKTRKPNRKRLRKRSVFQENKVIDSQHNIFYGDSDEASEQTNKRFAEESRKSNGEIVMKCSSADNAYGSNSISFEQPCRHIHPKLPDYDEIAAKFTALKRANLLIKKTN